MNKLSLTLIILGVLTIFLLGFKGNVLANPLLSYHKPFSTATTTVAVITPGTATTTTNVFDAKLGGASQALGDSATILIQLTGSSTATVLNWVYEYADDTTGVDCSTTPVACDWYADGIVSQATSTSPYSLTSTNTYSLKFASTTQGGAGGTGDGRVLRIVNVPTPARYTRAVFSLPVGSANGMVWYNWIVKKQQN